MKGELHAVKSMEGSLNTPGSVMGVLNVGDVNIYNYITGAKIDENGHLILYMETGAEIDCGEIAERDPTVSEWAKAPVKPRYTPEDLGMEAITNIELEALLREG